MIDESEYLALRHRPAGRLVMHQKWRSLLFIHYNCEPAILQALLPPGLTIDTFPDEDGREKAWLGLVPFRMEGVTPKGIPPIPGFHAFPETNVRTYVHRDGQKPGVWFFSLDAANFLACQVARRWFHLPYHEARMSVAETSNSVEYHSLRRSDQRRCDATCQLGKVLSPAQPGDLSFFLIERYLLYSWDGARLHTGQVHHSPYPLHSASVVSLHETLISIPSFEPTEIKHIAFSEGVNVEIFGLT